jgi:hypothetical protein
VSNTETLWPMRKKYVYSVIYTYLQIYIHIYKYYKYILFTKYVYSVNTGQEVPNIQHLAWFLDVKEAVSDDKSRVSTLCIQSPKKDILKPA